MRNWIGFNRFDLLAAGCYFGWGTDYLASGRYAYASGFLALSFVFGYFAWKATGVSK